MSGVAGARRILNLGLERFLAAGFERVAPPILQPADTLLEWAGENVRARAYFVGDGEAEALCLRTDHTIPTCRLYLEAASGEPKRFCYAGPAFRKPAKGPLDRGEFLEAGVEIYDRSDDGACEVEATAAALDLLDHAGVTGATAVMGDLALSDALIRALELPKGLDRSLRQAFRKGADAGTIEGLLTGRTAPSALERTLGALSEDRARALLDDVFSLAGVETVGGRTAGDVAERLIEKSEDARDARLDRATAQAVTRLFGVGAPADAAFEAVRAGATELGLDVDDSLGRASRRADALKAANPIWTTAEFATAFGRKLGYYSGFVFEIRHPALGPADPLAAGGRYDALLRHLGGPEDVAAMGAMLRPARIAKALGETA